MAESSLDLRLLRIYELDEGETAQRILIDRLWPRGVAKARVDHWARELAPSNELRRWYDHDPARWQEFRRRYFAELGAQADAVEALVQRLQQGPCVLLYASRERELNNATALRDFLHTRTARN